MREEISGDVFLIDTMALASPGLVACYLIRGEKRALVDTGYPTSANTILSELKAIDPSTWQVDYLIPTHVHLDHAGAAGHLVEVMPDAQVLVSKYGAKHLADPTRLAQGAASLFGKEAMSLLGTPIPVPPRRIQGVSDSRNLDLGAGRRLRLFLTPGHAWHHMSAFLERERLLLTGDAVGLRYEGYDVPIPATPPPGFDADHYAKTITEFIEMNPTALLLPHFGAVRKNVRAFLESNRETVGEWVSQALEVVNSGESLDKLFDLLMSDIVNRTGKSRDRIPDHIVQMVMFSAKGCYTYAQSTLASM